jgi:hypothetical protein
MQTRTKVRNGGRSQQVSIENGMGGEGDLEEGVTKQEMQVSTKDGMGGQGDSEVGVVG